MDPRDMIFRVKRGMVFWYDPFPYAKEKFPLIGINGKEMHSSVQSGKRPWVVVSRDLSNGSSSVCSIVPITTAERTETPVNVSFVYKGKGQRVLTEQITTVDIAVLREYECFLSENVMARIDEALCVQLGISYGDSCRGSGVENAVKNIESAMEKVIREKVLERDAEKVSKELLEGTAERLGKLFESLISKSLAECTDVVEDSREPDGSIEGEGQLVISEFQQNPTEDSVDVTGEVSIPSQVERFKKRFKGNAVLVHTIQESLDIDTPEEKVESEVVQKVRNVWSIEKCERFLNDFEILNEEEMMEKYGIKNHKSLNQMRRYTIKKIEGMV